MIYHQVRFTPKPDAPRDKLEYAFERLRMMGREIPVVQFWCVGRDFGGEFEYGALYALEDIEAYKAYMSSPIHRETDEVGLPLMKDFISFDITDDDDPTIGEQIAEVHRSRFGNDQALLTLVDNIGSYQGSGFTPRAER